MVAGIFGRYIQIVISDLPYLLLLLVLGVSIIGALKLRLNLKTRLVDIGETEFDYDTYTSEYEKAVKAEIWRTFWGLFYTIALNVLNLLFTPLWLVSLFLLPWRFCNGKHYADGRKIYLIYTQDNEESKVTWKNLATVLSLSLGNLLTFCVSVLALIVILVSIVFMIISPWRLRTNCKNLYTLLYERVQEDNGAFVIHDEWSFLASYTRWVV
jgi:hypothetical protein